MTDDFDEDGRPRYVATCGYDRVRLTERADYPMQRANCRACAVYALANGPDFYRGGLDCGDAKPYRKALASIFGGDWRRGHELVLEQAERLRQARGTTAGAA